MVASNENGILQRLAPGPVDDVVERLLSILRARSITIFVVVDHSGEAWKVGLEMPNTKLVVFGSPRAGTPSMLVSPSIALDLPLKILIAEGADGRTQISYNTASYLQDRHHLSAGMIPSIENIVEALTQ